MKTPLKTKQNLLELSKVITDLQIRYNLIIETLVDTLNLSDKKWIFSDEYEEIIIEGENSKI